MDEAKKNLVVVLSRNYATGLSVIRSLGAAGFEVDLVASAFKAGSSDIAAASKYVRNSVEVVSRKKSDGKDKPLLKELLKYKDMENGEQKPVLFPTDDYTAFVMDKYRNKLEEIFIMPSITDGKAGDMNKLMNKRIQSKLALEAGIPTPLEWTINLRKEKIRIPKDIVFPCFVKPIKSTSGFKREMKKCNSKKELRRHLRKLKDKNPDRRVLIQEFLEIEGEIDFSGVCFDQKVIIPAIIQKTNVAQYEKGVTLSGKLVPFEELGELCESIIKLMQSFHYTGMFDFELAIVNGQMYFNEVNLRSGGPNYSYFKSGVNLPALFVNEALGLGHKPEDEQVDEFGKNFIYEKIAWEDHMHGFMSRKELDKCIKNADIKLLLDDTDPVPGKMFTKNLKKEKQDRKKKAFKKAVLKITTDFKNYVKKVKKFTKRKIIMPVFRKAKRELLRFPQTKSKNKRNPESELPRVLVTGRNYCSNLTMARSIGKAGYEVEILKIFQVRPKWNNFMKKIRPDAYSKYIKAYYEFVSRRKPKRIVNYLIRIADPNHKMLLIPNDDLLGYIADRYYNKLSEYYIIPNVNGEAKGVSRLMRKGVQKRLAREAGLPVLNSKVFNIKKKAKFRIPNSITYPCFVKPNVSKDSAKSRMRKCKSKKELKAYLTKLSKKKDISMIVEDFVEIKNEYSILGVSTQGGVIGPGFFIAEKGGQKEHRGVAVVGRTLPTEGHQELIDNCLKFVESLNYNGLFDIDLIETPDGEMYFVEMNMRFGASGYAFTESGVNLPGMFADYMIKGIPLDLNAKVEETGKTFVSEKVLIEEYANGRISRKELNEYMNSTDIHFVLNNEDKAAYRHFKKFKLVASINRLKTTRPIKKAAKRFWRKWKSRIFRYALHLPQTKAKNRRNPESELPRVLVSGRNYCSNLTMARSLGEAGYDVEVLRIYQVKPKRTNLMKKLRPDAYSEYIKGYYECVSRRKPKVIVKRLIKLADPNHKMLLIPADDLVGYIADRYYNKLSEYYIIPNVNGEAKGVSRLMRKGVQKRLAREAGLPVINSRVFNIKKKAKFRIPKSVNYPCFVKPNVSKDSAKSRMRKCESKKELKAYLAKLSKKKDISMIVEDFVEIKNEYSILGVSTQEGVIGPGFFIAEKGGQKEHRGVAVVGRTLPTEEHQELIDNCLKFVESLNYNGLFDIDLIETPDGEMYFVELNMRFGASGYAFTESGVNLPGMFADYMIKGTPLDLNAKVEETGKTFVSEKVLIEEYVSGRISYKELNEYMNNTDIHFIKNDKDSIAYKHFKKFYAIAGFTKLAKKIKNR